MLKAVIIDDDPNARKSLQDDLQKFCPDVTLLGTAENVKAGVQLINAQKPQLVFLDVEMPDGTGFELLEKIKILNSGVDFDVIFTTAFDKFAVRAIKFSALDFLLKPVIADELIMAVEKAKISSTGKISMASLNALLSNVKQPNKVHKSIVLATADNVSVYPINEIIRCQSDRNYTTFYFINNQKLLVSKTLKDFDDLLSESGFERIHNSHLVNLSFVQKYVKSDGGYLIMKDGSTVPVSQRKKDQIMDILSSL